MKGLKGVINDGNYKMLMSRENYSNDFFCIVSYIGKIDSSGKIIIREKSKQFTDMFLVKQDLLKQIYRVMDYKCSPENIFNSIYASGLYQESLNSDNFYYNKGLRYTRAPDEFVIIVLTNMYCKNTSTSNKYTFDSHAYFNEDLMNKRRTYTQQYIYKVLENLDEYELPTEMIHQGAHENCVDLVPLDYIVLKPIQPLEVDLHRIENDDMVRESLKTLGFYSDGSSGIYSQENTDFQKLNFIYHEKSMMEFVTQSQGLVTIAHDPQYHEMENPFDHMQDIGMAVYKASQRQAQIMSENLRKFNEFSNNSLMLNMLKGSIEGFCKKEKINKLISGFYIKGFERMGIKEFGTHNRNANIYRRVVNQMKKKSLYEQYENPLHDGDDIVIDTHTSKQNRDEYDPNNREETVEKYNDDMEMDK